MLNIVLYAPRIPQNTGQIARACWAMNCRLHLVRPLGFRVDAPALKRSAVGYLAEMEFTVHENGEAFWAAIPDPARVWLVTKFGRTAYTKAAFRAGDWLLMGNETEGLPPEWLERHAARTLRIPMANPACRCLNLATSAAVVMFEALRQIAPE
jgi:tRNA (cytidine/uridine-2'-O-)-methyltransferase